MLLSFVVLMPCAVAASMLRYLLPESLWFQIHRFCNYTAFFLVVIGFGIAFFIITIVSEKKIETLRK